MFIMHNNQKGASLVEIIATISLTSIVLILIYQIFSHNIRLNSINREQTINANIANGIINYISSQDFETFNSYLGENKYVKIDADTCTILFTDENEINNCNIVFSPLIINKQYTSDNLYAFIFPYYGPEGFKDLEGKKTKEILSYLNNLDNYNYDYKNDNTLTVLVVVESSLNSRYDYLLWGVITKW